MVDRPVGQFRATSGCPICGAKDNGKWTCPACTVVVSVHRELIRNLQQWRALYEDMQVPDVLVAADARSYSLWDAERFYESRHVVPERMSQSIEWYLYENLKESDAALKMGISPANPVGIYATIGLTTMISKAISGELPGYQLDLDAEVPQWLTA